MSRDGAVGGELGIAQAQGAAAEERFQGSEGLQNQYSSVRTEALERAAAAGFLLFAVGGFFLYGATGSGWIDALCLALPIVFVGGSVVMKWLGRRSLQRVQDEQLARHQSVDRRDKPDDDKMR